jgi:hypothetical protein
MVALLIIKAGNDYLRFDGHGYHRCELNQASVYPLAQAAAVRARCRQVCDQGVAAVALKKLVIREEPYPMEE